MSLSEYEMEVAAFIDKNGITRCPTACAVRTQGTVSTADREELQRRAAEIEARRHRRRFVTPFGKKSGQARQL